MDALRASISKNVREGQAGPRTHLAVPRSIPEGHVGNQRKQEAPEKQRSAETGAPQSTWSGMTCIPRTAPKPFVIIINKPWALDRVLASVVVSTNKEPEILKKSKEDNEMDWNEIKRKQINILEALEISIAILPGL